MEKIYGTRIFDYIFGDTDIPLCEIKITPERVVAEVVQKMQWELDHGGDSFETKILDVVFYCNASARVLQRGPAYVAASLIELIPEITHFFTISPAQLDVALQSLRDELACTDAMELAIETARDEALKRNELFFEGFIAVDANGQMLDCGETLEWCQGWATGIRFARATYGAMIAWSYEAYEHIKFDSTYSTCWVEEEAGRTPPKIPAVIAQSNANGAAEH